MNSLFNIVEPMSSEGCVPDPKAAYFQPVLLEMLD